MSEYKMKSVDIKGKPYIQVHERLKYFHTSGLYAGFSIETELVSHENGKVLFKAIVKDNNSLVKSTGHAQEIEGDGFINKSSYVENCETSAVGRALANLGIGIDAGIASAEEIQKTIEMPENKIKDAVIHIKNGGSWAEIEKKYTVSNSMKSTIMDLVDNG